MESQEQDASEDGRSILVRIVFAELQNCKVDRTFAIDINDMRGDDSRAMGCGIRTKDVKEEGRYKLAYK